MKRRKGFTRKHQCPKCGSTKTRPDRQLDFLRECLDCGYTS